MQAKCHDCDQMVEVDAVHVCDGSMTGRYDPLAFIRRFLKLNLEGWTAEQDAANPRLYHITAPDLPRVPPPSPPEPEREAEVITAADAGELPALGP